MSFILNGCTETVTDTVTEEKIKIIEKPDSSLTKVLVRNRWDVSRSWLWSSASLWFDTDIARIVGLPGETVSVKKGQVYINQKKLDSFYGDDSTFNNNDSWDEVTLKYNEYYILADVRWRGLNDSQTAGPFLRQDVLGKVVGYEKNG